MASQEIDDVDRAILYALQADARNTSSGDIAERTGTSDSTVRKRIRRLEADGVIRGYRADVDYRRSGYPLRVLGYCTPSITERGGIRAALPGVEGAGSRPGRGPGAVGGTVDASLAAAEVFAGGTVANRADSPIDAELALEFRVDGELVTSTAEPISVPAGGETSLEVSLATVEDLSSDQIQAINQGSYEIRYALANETVATYTPET